MRIRVAFVALILLGCGDTTQTPVDAGIDRLPSAPCATDRAPAQLIPATSGTRLRATWLTGSDGAKQFLAMHDTMMNADCMPQRDATGQERCLPVRIWSTSTMRTRTARCR